MASSYTVVDQAADLGIHRVHSLVLGDAKKEARIAARFSPPQFKQLALGSGDARLEGHQYEWQTRRELERIARRHNLKKYCLSRSQMKFFTLSQRTYHCLFSCIV
jgi:hypothetical protein